MAGFNQVILTGKVGKSPQLQYDRASVAHAALQLLCEDVHQNAAGDWIEKEQLFELEFEGEAAENLHQQVKKGDIVLVEGRLKIASKQIRIVGKTIRVLAQATTFVPDPWSEASQGVSKLDVWGNLTKQQPEK